MIWRPFFSPPSIVAGVVLLAALALWSCLRTFRIRPLLSVVTLAMRLGLIVLLAVILFGPSKLPPVSTRPERPELTILLDTSASMQTRDIGSQSRVEFAFKRWLSEENLARLKQEYKVSILGFDEAPYPMSAKSQAQSGDEIASGKVSHIVGSIETVISTMDSQKPGSQSLLVLSDGRDTDDGPFQLAHAGVELPPIHTVGLGSAVYQEDLAVVALPMQEYLLRGEEGKLVVRVLQTGADHGSTKVHVSCEGETVTRDVSFDGRPSVDLEFPVKKDRLGVHEYLVLVDPVVGEIEKRNNEQRVFLEVTGKRLKVLLVEGQPFWDTKFLAQSLRKDERVELTQITQVTPFRQETIVTRTEPQGDSTPDTLEELALYDVIVLGRAIDNIFDIDTIRLLPEYVSKHGGRILFARGRAYDPTTPAGREVGHVLRVLEPVVWGDGVLNDQQMAIDSVAGVHPVFAFAEKTVDVQPLLAEMPVLAAVPIVTREKVLAKVLARSKPPGMARGRHRGGQPTVISMEYDRGLVVAINGQGLWKWCLLPEEKKHLSFIFDRFWSNLIRWLAMGSQFKPGEQVSLRLSRRSVELGNRVTIDFSCRFPLSDDFEPDVRVIDPEGTSHTVALSLIVGSTLRRRAEFRPQVAGIHRVVAHVPSSQGEGGRVESKFNVYELDTERLHSAANPVALRMLSEQSGGRVLDPDSPESFLQEAKRARLAAIMPPKLEYVWDRGSLLFFLLSWAGVEWLLRKLGGLL